MAEMPGPVVFVDLCGKKSDTGRKLGRTVYILIASTSERDAGGSSVIQERAVMGPQLSDI